MEHEVNKKRVVFKTTYPNGKIYIGSDETDCIDYFGSPATKTHLEIEKDFSNEARRDFTLKKQILWESDSASNEEMLAKEFELIIENESHNPAKGYNRNPKWKG